MERAAWSRLVRPASLVVIASALAWMAVIALPSGAAGISAGWNVVASTPEGGPAAVAFADETHGWVVGSFGPPAAPMVPHSFGVLFTIDGGATWSPGGGAIGLRDVVFVDAYRGWSIADTRYDPVIFRTTDGGTTWIPGTFPAGVGPIIDTSFVDSEHGWALANPYPGSDADEEMLLSTSDGGATWKIRDTLAAAAAVDFLDSRHGWIVGYSGRIMTTFDAGRSWKPQWSGTKASLSDVDFVNSRDGWATGYELVTVHGQDFETGVILGTTDGGTTWKRQSAKLIAPADCASVSFIDPKHGWVIGDSESGSYWHGVEGWILATDDGGATWVSEALPIGTGFLQDLTFRDAVRGWAVAYGVEENSGRGPGQILSTTAAGLTLRRLAPVSAAEGDSLKLYGSGMSDAAMVMIGGQSVPFAIESDHLITAIVPSFVDPVSRYRVKVMTPTHVVMAENQLAYLIRPRLTLGLVGLSEHSLQLGRRVTVHGGAEPDGLAGEGVAITLQRRVEGRWRTVALVKRSIGTGGALRPVVFRPAARAMFRVRLTMAKTTTHTGAATTWRWFRVD